MDLLSRIDHWAEIFPERLAHVSGDRKLTYRELRSQSDALAAHLAGRLGDNRSPIAVIGHKEPEMLVAFLGAVKSGRPYVPIDLSDPKATIERLIGERARWPEIAANGRVWARTHYSPDAVAARLVDYVSPTDEPAASGR